MSEAGRSADPMQGARIGGATVGTLFRQRALIEGDRTALIEGARRLSFAALNRRVNRLAHVFLDHQVSPGQRVAILARNCMEYVEVELACAKIGAIVAAQNWRLADGELAHCISLVEPTLIVAAAGYIETLGRLDIDPVPVIALGDDYEERLAKASTAEPHCRGGVEIDPEDGFVILYTSGTTGLPKGALISHRATIARSLVIAADLGTAPQEAFVAWAPFFHMASTDQGLGALLRGGPVIIVDGYDAQQLVEIIETHVIGWLPLIPGMIEDFVGVLKETRPTPKGIRLVGAMADLVPPHQIAEATRLLGAPYVNSFGATETGLPPATAAFIPIGEIPTDLAKRQSAFCEVKLVDEDGGEVGIGEPGECAVRGPTVFSGYWRAPEANAKDFRGGWFHMGDVFARREDGRFVFMDRVKYMIKSGGENIYPAEIERVLLSDPRVDDAVVVRKPDARWGEVPVAAIAANSDELTTEHLLAQCRAALAGYKQPKEIRFVAFETLPRSTTGKIQRHEVETWFVEG